MSQGELLTRLTIWLALGGYAFGAAAHFIFRNNLKWQARARWAWTIGCIGMLAHVACAYDFYHAWSQTSAYRETARQTAEVFGLDWGGGLYINYAFIAVWVLDVVWWWRGLEAYIRRPRWLVLAWHGFFLFMVFNATVVFKTGVLRWIGVIGCLALVILLWMSGRHSMYSSSKGISA
jgi:hypothetical protein